MMSAKIFPNGQSQAIRIPKEFRFKNQKEVFVTKEGEIKGDRLLYIKSID